MFKIVMSLYGQKSESVKTFTFSEVTQAISETKSAAMRYGHSILVWYEWSGTN